MRFGKRDKKRKNDWRNVTLNLSDLNVAYWEGWGLLTIKVWENKSNSVFVQKHILCLVFLSALIRSIYLIVLCFDNEVVRQIMKNIYSTFSINMIFQ